MSGKQRHASKALRTTSLKPDTVSLSLPANNGNNVFFVRICNTPGYGCPDLQVFSRRSSSRQVQVVTCSPVKLKQSYVVLPGFIDGKVIFEFCCFNRICQNVEGWSNKDFLTFGIENIGGAASYPPPKLPRPLNGRIQKQH